jgi:hypothetical protein
MTIPKLLAQLIPSAATLTAFYTVPAGSRCTAATFFICNRNAAATTFRIAVAPKGDPDATQHYLYYDSALAGNETKLLEVQLRLTETDVVRVYAPAANVAFSLFGTEEV